MHPDWKAINTIDELIDGLMANACANIVLREDIKDVIQRAIELTEQRKPLTKKQAEKIINNHTYDDDGYGVWKDGMGIVRSVEAAHGIKG